MEKVLKAGRIRRGEQRFYLGNDEISGVQDVSISYPNNIAPVKSLGMDGKSLISTFRGPQEASASITSQLISKDFFIELTGDVSVNGYLLKDKGGGPDNFSFTSGFLTSYSANFGVNQIPEISTDFLIVGDAGKISPGSYDEVSGHLSQINVGQTQQLDHKVSSPGSLDVIFDDAEANRLQAVSVGINVDRSVTYGMGSRFPVSVDTNWPIEINCSFTFDIDEYQANSMRGITCSQEVKNLFIRANDIHDDSLIAQYCFENLYKVSEAESIGVENNKTLNVNYIGWLYEKPMGKPPTIICPGNQSGGRNEVFGPLDFSFIDEDSIIQCI